MATIEVLMQQAARAKRHAARLEARISTQKRSHETRRKILMGAAVIELCAQDNQLDARFRAHLDFYITRKSDRSILGLETKSDSLIDQGNES